MEASVRICKIAAEGKYIFFQFPPVEFFEVVFLFFTFYRGEQLRRHCNKYDDREQLATSLSKELKAFLCQHPSFECFALTLTHAFI